MQSLQAENVFEILNVQHLLCIFGTSYDLFPLRISDSLRVLVASWQKAESSWLPWKKRKRSWMAVTLYIQTIWIQFKTAVKNTVLHIYPKDHIFYTLYIFLQYDTVYGLEEILFFRLKKKIEHKLKERTNLCLKAVQKNSYRNVFLF